MSDFYVYEIQIIDKHNGNCECLLSPTATSGCHSIERITHAGHSIAFNIFNVACLEHQTCSVFIDWRCIMMDYPCAKFDDCIFSRFGFIALNMFLHFCSCDLDPWPFDLLFIDRSGIMMDYPCAKFGNSIVSRFGFIVRANRQTDRQTDRQTESHTDANERFTHAILSLVGVSNNK